MGAEETDTEMPISEVGPHPEASLAKVPRDMFGFGAMLQMMYTRSMSTASMG